MKYTFDVICPRCGGDPEHVTGSRTDATLTLTVRAVCRCITCRAEWLLEVGIAPASPAVGDGRERPPCGTEQGYKAHTRRGEPSCPACRTAHRIYQRGTPSGQLPHRQRRKVTA